MLNFLPPFSASTPLPLPSASPPPPAGEFNDNFVNEFRTFTSELRDFFNAGSLTGGWLWGGGVVVVAEGRVMVALALCWRVHCVPAVKTLPPFPLVTK